MTARRGSRWIALLPLVALGLAACLDGGAPSASTGAGPRSPAPRSSTPHASPAALLPATPRLGPAVAGTALGGWVGPIYPPHAHGYDLSYPQCSATGPPGRAAFAIVGVNDGKAFTVNPCLPAQWQAASRPRAVYFNSGYKPENADRATADCRSRSQLQALPDDQRLAYAIGCSEGEYSLAAIRAAGAASPVMVWMDVESSNSWDGTNLPLNREALQGEIDQVAASGRPVGLYATFAGWQEILGPWSPNGVVADWVAGRLPQTPCGTPGFSGHRVWLVQELAPWGPAGDDSDWAC